MGKYSDIKAGNSIMVQISKKDKEKVLGALHSGKIDTAEKPWRTAMHTYTGLY